MTSPETREHLSKNAEPERRSLVGKGFILWKTDFRLDAYKDQFDRPHKGHVVLEEISVVVAEEREVRGIFAGLPEKGLRAITEDGREFTCNWHSFPDDSTAPTLYWDVVEEADGELWQPENSYQAFNTARGRVYVREDGTRAVPTGAEVCPEHDRVFKKGESCLNCYFRQKGEEMRRQSSQASEIC